MGRAEFSCSYDHRSQCLRQVGEEALRSKEQESVSCPPLFPRGNTHNQIRPCPLGNIIEPALLVEVWWARPKALQCASAIPSTLSSCGSVYPAVWVGERCPLYRWHLIACKRLEILPAPLPGSALRRAGPAPSLGSIGELAQHGRWTSPKVVCESGEGASPTIHLTCGHTGRGEMPYPHNPCPSIPGTDGGADPGITGARGLPMACPHQLQHQGEWPLYLA